MDKKIFVLWLAGIWLLCAPGLSHAKEYEWIDRDGHRHFADYPDPSKLSNSERYIREEFKEQVKTTPVSRVRKQSLAPVKIPRAAMVVNSKPEPIQIPPVPSVVKQTPAPVEVNAMPKMMARVPKEEKTIPIARGSIPFTEAEEEKMVSVAPISPTMKKISPQARKSGDTWAFKIESCSGDINAFRHENHLQILQGTYFCEGNSIAKAVSQWQCQSQARRGSGWCGDIYTECVKHYRCVPESAGYNRNIVRQEYEKFKNRNKG